MKKPFIILALCLTLPLVSSEIVIENTKKANTVEIKTQEARISRIAPKNREMRQIEPIQTRIARTDRSVRQTRLVNIPDRETRQVPKVMTEMNLHLAQLP